MHACVYICAETFIFNNMTFIPYILVENTSIILCLWYATNQTSEILFHIGLPIFVGESVTDLEWSVQCSECQKHLCRACFTYTV